MDIENKIIQGDCLGVMKEFPSNIFDAIVTDPPFGIGYTYDGEKEKFDKPDGYWRWLKPRYQEMKRVLRRGGFLAIWQSQEYMKYFWDWFGKDIHIYVSCKTFVQMNRPDIHNYPITMGYEPIVMKYLGKPYRCPENPKRSLDWSVGKTHKYVLEENSLAGKHPCPRPLNTVKEIIQNFVIEGGIVLDPFLGSGTTAVGCKQLNRKYVGIEIKKKYIQIARKRLRRQEKPISSYLQF